MILLQTPRDHHYYKRRWYNQDSCIRALSMDRSQIFESFSSKETNSEQFKLKTGASSPETIEAIQDSDKQAILR